MRFQIRDSEYSNLLSGFITDKEGIPSGPRDMK